MPAAACAADDRDAEDVCGGTVMERQIARPKFGRPPFRTTQPLFVKALREAGADPIESVGARFDPRLHEAVATVPSNDVEPGTVVGEIRRGWRLGDQLLRPAQVAVAAGPEESAPWR